MNASIHDASAITHTSTTMESPMDLLRKIDELAVGEELIVEAKNEGDVRRASAHVRVIRSRDKKKLRMTLVNGITRDLRIERLA